MFKSLIAGIIVVLVLATFVFFISNKSKQANPSAQPISSQIETKSEEEFSNPKKSAHFESNTPEHGSTLAGVPINIVINFNFDLGEGSKIEIHGLFSKEQIGANEYGVGETMIDSNKLSMRRKMQSDSPDGKYSVAYTACWPDKTCHNGSFQFKIDRKQASDFEDMVGKKEVMVKMSQIKFNPASLRVSTGTKVTWVNDDEEDHFVNIDSHPAHTYLLDLNSKVLKKGDKYSYTFEKAGIYPYHCSAHESSMKANLLVE